MNGILQTCLSKTCVSQFIGNFALSGVVSITWLFVAKNVTQSNRARGYHLQMHGQPYSTTYQQPHNSNHLPNSQQVYGNIGHQGQSLHNPSTSYNNHAPYGAQQRSTQYEGTQSNHMVSPMQNLPHGPAFTTQPSQHAGKDFYTPPEYCGPGHSNTQPVSQTNHTQSAYAQSTGTRGFGPPRQQGACEVQRSVSSLRDTRGGSPTIYHDNTAKERTPAAPPLGRQAVMSTPKPYTFPAAGTLHDQHDSTLEQVRVAHANNSPMPLSTNSSKSSPPYTASQRKQLRVEEKSYLKEVKRSIAEGRVPQVRLQQNTQGNIVQYKAQFLNALKLAALAIAPTADIDIHNHATMHEIMNEVQRQFIIEKPLPEGMVSGFLQHLYKRKRAVYHRHWTMHGDESKPDDCSLAAWQQLVDY